MNEGRPGPGSPAGAGRDDDAGLGGQEHGGGDQHDVRGHCRVAGRSAPFVFGRFLSVADVVSAVVRLHSVALRDEIASGSGQQVAVTIGSRNRHSGGPEMKRFVEVGARPCR